MIKIYYGNNYKEAYGNDPVFIDEGAYLGYEEAYPFVEQDEITYDDLQNYMSDEQRLELYNEMTSEVLDQVNDEFWDWAEEAFEVSIEWTNSRIYYVVIRANQNPDGTITEAPFHWCDTEEEAIAYAEQSSCALRVERSTCGYNPKGHHRVIWRKK